MRKLSIDLERRIANKIQTLYNENEPKAIVSMGDSPIEIFPIDFNLIEPYSYIRGGTAWWSEICDFSICNDYTKYVSGTEYSYFCLCYIASEDHHFIEDKYEFTNGSLTRREHRDWGQVTGEHCTYSSCTHPHPDEPNYIRTQTRRYFIHNGMILCSGLEDQDWLFPDISDISAVVQVDEDQWRIALIFLTDKYESYDTTSSVVNGIHCLCDYEKHYTTYKNIPIEKDDVHEQVIRVDASFDSRLTIIYTTKYNDVYKVYIWRSVEMSFPRTADDIIISGSYTEKVCTYTEGYVPKSSAILPRDDAVVSYIMPQATLVTDIWEVLHGANIENTITGEKNIIYIEETSLFEANYEEYIFEHWDDNVFPFDVNVKYKFNNVFGEFVFWVDENWEYHIANSNYETVSITYFGDHETISLGHSSTYMPPITNYSRYNNKYAITRNSDGSYNFCRIYFDPNDTGYSYGHNDIHMTQFYHDSDNIFTFKISSGQLAGVNFNVDDRQTKFEIINSKRWNGISLCNLGNIVNKSGDDYKYIAGVVSIFDEELHNNVLYAFKKEKQSSDYMALQPLSGTLKSQVDNPIVSCDITLSPDQKDLLTIGSKFDLSFQFGSSEQFPMGVFYVDSIDYDILGKTVNVSARNAIGHILNDQTFDEDVTITGEPKDIAEYVLNRFGVEKFDVQTAQAIEGAQFEWKANTTGLTALNDLFTMYSPTYQLTNMWTMIETPDGTIVIGFDPYRARYMPNTRYDFEKDEEVFSRKISTAIDGVYSHVRCEGTDQNGEPLTPVILPVTTIDGWTVGSHKTYHAPALDGATQEELETYTTHFARELARVGRKQSFSSPIRPHLLVGDVARIYSNQILPIKYEEIGIISEVTHTFGEKGFKTDFTLDSGGHVGYAPEPGIDYVVTRSLSINGDTRKKRIIDFIKK